jgi:4'-phosphopantetheinyl transferase EntD
MPEVRELEQALRARFGADVRLSASWLTADVPPLMPEEAVYAEPAVLRRRQELAVGRHLARTVLSELGGPWGPLLRRKDRTVVWPPGYSATISHTKDVVAAAAALSEAVPCLGLDVEASTVSLNLVDKLLRPEEQTQLFGLTEAQVRRRATIVFSAKEAFYKAQYPSTQTFLGFMDVRLDMDLKAQRATAVVVREDSPLQGLQLSGFWVESGPWVASGFMGRV